MLVEGKLAEFIFFIVSAAITYYYAYSASKGKSFSMLPMPQIDAISDAVDMGVETGKPIYFTPGCFSYISGMYVAMTAAAMNVLRYLAELCVRRGARLICLVPVNPETYPLMQGIVKEAAVSQGKPEYYNEDDIYYKGQGEVPFQGDMAAAFERTGIAAIVDVGALSGGEAMAFVVAGNQGALCIGGGARIHTCWLQAALADYPVFMEEVIAMGAAASGDNVAKASIVAADVLKLVLMLLAFILVILPQRGWLSL